MGLKALYKNRNRRKVIVFILLAVATLAFIFYFVFMKPKIFSSWNLARGIEKCGEIPMAYFDFPRNSTYTNVNRGNKYWSPDCRFLIYTTYASTFSEIQAFDPNILKYYRDIQSGKVNADMEIKKDAGIWAYNIKTKKIDHIYDENGSDLVRWTNDDEFIFRTGLGKLFIYNLDSKRLREFSQ